MNDYITVYRKYLTENGASLNTVSSYSGDVKIFVSYCEARNIRFFNEIDDLFISDYLKSLSGKSDSTVNRTAVSLRSYFSFLKSRKLCSANPAESVRVRAVKQKLPEVLTPREINLLCDFEKNSNPKAYRDSVMIYLCAFTGITVSELCAANTSDFNFNIGILRVQSLKGKGARTVPLDEKTQKYLQTYIRKKRTSLVPDSDSEIMFPNMNGGRMSRQGFWKILKSRAEKAKIKKQITPNTLKFSYVLKLVEDGADNSYIMDVLGYNNSVALKKYSGIIKERYSLSKNKEFH